jgi:hypothetical protein
MLGSAVKMCDYCPTLIFSKLLVPATVHTGTTHPRTVEVSGISTTMDEFYFTTDEKKILENC